MSLLQETSRKQPDAPDVLHDLAEALYSIDRVPDAEATMRHALDARAPLSRADEARRFLEMLAFAANPSQGAVQEAKIEQALKADPGYVPALRAMAAVSEQRSDFRAARKNYEEALSHCPDFTPAKRRLAILSAANPGDNQKACDLATKAREGSRNHRLSAGRFRACRESVEGMFESKQRRCRAHALLGDGATPAQAERRKRGIAATRTCPQSAR
jgi:tetratricopeptide (TPR) repeat protein